MATIELDLRGLKCPMPTLKLTGMVVRQEFKAGDIVAATADCPTFEKDVKEWCKKMQKVLIVMKDVGGNTKTAEIRI